MNDLNIWVVALFYRAKTASESEPLEVLLFDVEKKANTTLSLGEREAVLSSVKYDLEVGSLPVI
jgi:hypothetical protein